MTSKDVLSYVDFDLLIECSGGQYRARVLNSPAGGGEVLFQSPFSNLELENFYLRLGLTRQGLRRVDAPEVEAVRSLGARLFDTVFTDDVLAAWRTAQSQAAAQGKGLRIRLRLEAGELSGLPWEYLYNQRLNRFLSLGSDTPLVRYLDLPQPLPALVVQSPLHMLVMISSPTDFSPLDVESEWRLIQEALNEVQDAGLVQVERLEQANLSALQRRLRRGGDVHVLHFIGHGQYDKEHHDGRLLFEDELGRGRLLSGEDLGVVLHNHRSLRLVVLNACEGARTSPDDPFAGVAQSVIQQGIPAVVAMQFPITDRAATAFAREFYGALADGYPLDAALVEARLAIYNLGNDIEWGTPVCFSRTSEGRIFAIDTASSPPKSSRSLAPSPLPDPELEKRLEQLYTDGLEASVLQNWERAGQIYRSIAQVRPNYQDVSVRLAEAERQLGLARLYTDAQAAVQGNDWSTAVSILERLVSQERGYRDVGVMLENARRQAVLANLYGQARRLCQGKRWQAALSIFDQVHAQQPDYSDPEGLEQHARQSLEAERQQAERRVLHRQALTALDAGQWEQAVSVLERLLAEAPDYPNAVNLLQRAKDGLAAEQRRAALDKQFVAAQKAVAAGQYDAAVRDLDALVANAPDYAGAAALLQRAKDEQAAAQRQAALDKQIAVATKVLAAGQYETAIRMLEGLQADAPDQTNVATLLQQARNEQAKAQHLIALGELFAMGQKALADGQYKAAVESLERLRAEAPNDPRVAALLQQARDGQRQAALDEQFAAAQKAVEAGQYEAAVRTLEDLLVNAPKYPKAANLLKQTKDRLAAAQRQVALDEQFAAAQKAVEGGQYKAAVETLEGLLAKAPKYSKAADLLRLAKNQMAGQIHLVRDEPVEMDKTAVDKDQQTLSTSSSAVTAAPQSEHRISTRYVSFSVAHIVIFVLTLCIGLLTK